MLSSEFRDFYDRKFTLYLEDYVTETMLKKEDLAHYDFIHFSCHGKGGHEIEGVYRQPALLLTADEENDGFLFMEEVYGLKMDAQLVTLASCETGSGKYQHGEGITSLTRAFMYAGTSSVVVSLWPVEDASTSKLMAKLYENLKTLPKSQALRQAKLALIQEKSEWKGMQRMSYAHPFFWAPFLLYGEGR